MSKEVSEAIYLLNKQADKPCTCLDSVKMCLSCASFNALAEFKEVDSRDMPC